MLLQYSPDPLFSQPVEMCRLCSFLWFWRLVGAAYENKVVTHVPLASIRNVCKVCSRDGVCDSVVAVVVCMVFACLSLPLFSPTGGPSPRAAVLFRIVIASPHLWYAGTGGRRTEAMVSFSWLIYLRVSRSVADGDASRVVAVLVRIVVRTLCRRQSETSCVQTWQVVLFCL